MALCFHLRSSVAHAAALLIALVLIPESAHAARPLSGTVRDAQTLLPVSHAVVELRETGRTVEADADGRFVFDPLPDGDYHLCVKRIGYRRRCDIEVHVGAEDLPAPAVLLEPEPLSGRPVDVRGTRPDSAPAPEASRIVISAEQIKESGGTTVADVLERQGIEIVRRGSEAAVTIRGSRPEAVQVKVDGVAVNPGGAADLATIPVASIESIEIVRGPSAVAGGVDALAGAVLIHTRAPAGERAVSLGGGTGSFAERWTDVQLDGLGTGPERLRLGWHNELGGGTFTYDDPQAGPDTKRINNDFHRQQFMAEVAGEFAHAWRWASSASYFRAHAGVPGAEYQLTPSATRRERRYVYAARASHLDYRGTLELGYSFIRDWNRYENPGTLPYRTENQSDVHSVRASYTSTAGRSRGIAFSAEYIHERLAGVDLLNPAYSFGTARRDHYATTLRYQRSFELGRRSVRDLGLDFGLRYDQAHTTGEYPQTPVSAPVDAAVGTWRTLNPQVQATLAGAWSRLAWSCFAGYSSAFRRPPLVEQFWQESYRTRGNPALEPERARQFESGYGLVRPGWLRLSWQQQFYFTRYRDLIYWRAGQGGVYSPANIGSASVDGREEELRVAAWSGAVGLTLRHEFQNHRNTAGEPNTDGQPLPFRYRHKTQASIRGAYRQSHLELARRWYDRRYLREAGTASKSLDPYAVTELTAGVHGSIGAVQGELTLSVLNLGNASYETIEREPMPGRSYHVNLQLEL